MSEQANEKRSRTAGERFLSDTDSDFLTLGGNKSSAGIRVNNNAALTYAAWWRGINLIAGDVGKLPLDVHRELNPGKSKDKEHPAYRLLRRKPNDRMTAFIWKQTMQAHKMSFGNGYSYIYRRGDGAPVEIWPLSPVDSYPILENGVLWYITKVGDQLRKLPACDVLHFRGLGFDGLIGYDVITMACETIGLGLGVKRYGSLFFKNSARPGVVIQHPDTLSDAGIAKLKKSYTDLHQGLENQHKALVLEEGATVAPFAMSAVDSQLVESREFEIREIANFLGVPPHKLGDSSRTAYNSLEQENQSYLDDGLDPHLVVFEEECMDKLLTEEEKKNESHCVEFNRAALVRADLGTRYEGYSKALNAGWMNRDEVRARENLNPMPDGQGQVFLEPTNMTEAGSAGDDTDRARPIIVDAVKRMVRRISKQAGKAAKKPGSFTDWLSKTETDNRNQFVEAVTLAGSLISRAESDNASAAIRAADEFFEVIRTGLEGITESRSEQFAAMVTKTTADMERSLPERITDVVIGGSNNGA